MNRNIRRVVTVIIGLGLGWYVAGVAPLFDNSFAGGDQNHHQESGQGASDVSHDGGHEDDAGLLAARQLVPKPEDITWYPAVLIIAAGLWIAALVFGIPASKLRVPEPAEPDDHSHDDHH